MLAAARDTHFAKRDGMDRLLVFLARILPDRWPNGFAVAGEEKAAVLVNADGRTKIVGAAFFGRSNAAQDLQ